MARLFHNPPLKVRRRRTILLTLFIAVIFVIALLPLPFDSALPAVSLKPLQSFTRADPHLAAKLRRPELRFEPNPPVDRSAELQAVLRPVAHLTANPVTTKKYVLYRAIGNDLPPRHAVGQTYDNVKFVLENERPKPGLDVRWYLNRIVDFDEQLRIVKLLVHHRQLFTMDIFNFSAFALTDFQFNTPYKEPDILRSNYFRTRPSTDILRNRAWDIIFEQRNQFIIHNNHARNAMIDLGKQSNAMYILPWDGNCLLSDRAWQNISSKVDELAASDSSHISKLYFYVPMTRVTDNDQLKDPTFQPTSMNEEPQIIFHRDAITRFDESKPYGYRPKVDLLWRLRIPDFQYHNKNGVIIPDTQPHKLAKDAPVYDSVRPVGWTARLFSGNTRLERGGAALLRGRSRSDGVELIAARAWHRVAQDTAAYCRQATLFLLDRRVLAERMHMYARNDTTVGAEVARLVVDAEGVVAAVEASTPHGQSISVFAQSLVTAGLAALFTGEERFAVWGAARVRTWLVDDATRVDVTDIRSVRDGVNVCLMLDGVRLLRFTGSVTEHDFEAVTQWASRYAQLIEQSGVWRKAYFSERRDAVLYEAASACAHAFAGNFSMVLRRTALARGRMNVHFAANGTYAEREGLLGMEAWVMLALMAERVGVNMWEFREMGLPVDDGTVPALMRGLQAVLVGDGVHMDAMRQKAAGAERDAESVMMQRKLDVVRRVLVTVGRKRLGKCWEREEEVNEDLRKISLDSEQLLEDSDDGDSLEESVIPPYWNLAMI